MTNRLMFGVVGIAVSLSANPCAADGDPFLGEIDTFAFNFRESEAKIDKKMAARAA